MGLNTLNNSFRYLKFANTKVCFAAVLTCFSFSLLYLLVIDPNWSPCSSAGGYLINSDCRTEEESLINKEIKGDSALFPKGALREHQPSNRDVTLNQLNHIRRNCLTDGSLQAKEPWHFEKQNDSVIMKSKEFKTILVMVGNYGYKSLGFGFGHEPFAAGCCKEKRCFLTDNRKLLPVENFDAIIFHYRTFLPLDLPRKRTNNQRYILFDLEPSAYLYQNPKIYDGVFNWTMTFRKDSDVPMPYGRSILKSLLDKSYKTKIENKFTNVNFAEGKNSLVAWFVSRCTSASWREHFVEDLQHHIQVDIYGSCGPLSCSLKTFDECYQMVEKNYKFYLSFENSLCQDYVTEKFFNILRYNIVPIVFGGADYVADAPPHSYINAMNFVDTRSLADYLHYLDANDTAYNEYFRWKGDYLIPTNWENSAINFCNLCQKLHEDQKPKTYEVLSEYLIDKAKCQRVQPVSWFEKFVSAR